MKNRPLVSVIVPTYDRYASLSRALESIERQTFQDYEVIVVNDGGNSVSDVVAEFSKAKLIDHPENRGLPAARNTALHAAVGKYATYLDDDDEFLPNHLQVLTEKLENSGFQAAYTDCFFAYPDGRKVREMSFDFDRDVWLTKNITPCICVMHELGILKGVGYFDESLPNHEDWDMWIRMSRFYDFVHIPEITAIYYKHPGSMSADHGVMLEGYWDIRLRYGTAFYGERVKA